MMVIMTVAAMVSQAETFLTKLLGGALHAEGTAGTKPLTIWKESGTLEEERKGQGYSDRNGQGEEW